MKKLMVIILLILAVLFFTVTGSIPLDAVPDEMARKVAVLKEIYKPMQIDVDSNHLYVSQLSTVYIYSLEDFQLKNKTEESMPMINTTTRNSTIVKPLFII